MRPNIWMLLVVSLSAVASAGAQDLPAYGRTHLAEGDNLAAAKSYTELLQLNPFDPVALNNLAVAKAAAGDYQTAISRLTRSAKLAPSRGDIRENLARMQRWMDSYGAAGPPPVARPGQTAVRSATVLPEPPALWGAASKNGNSPLALPAPTR